MLVYEKAKPLIGNMLNYEVVGGTTAPTTFRKENTIWVNTDMEIGEHEFSYAHSGILKDSTKTSKATSTIIFHANTTSLTTHPVGRSAFFECLSNTNYEIHKSAGNLWYIATTQEAPADGVAINILKSVVDSSNTINITTGSNANYLVVFVSNESVEPDITLTSLDIIDTRADGSDLQNGDIWIQTDIDKAPAGFNAIKKNELMIYPIKLNQWTGSKWKSVAGTLYQGGTATSVYGAEEQLYPNGGFTPASNSSYMNGGSANGFKITLSGTTNKNANRYIGTIDLSKYKSIKIGYTATIENASNNKSYPTIALVTDTNFYAVYVCGVDNTLSDKVICYERITAAGSGTVIFDVSSLSSSVYVWEGLWENTSGIGGGTLEITSVIAEPA